MVTAQTQYNLANARSYFAEHLAVGDYYTKGQQVAGNWFGLGAERLGLQGPVKSEEFLRLCENQHPVSGSTLTQRLNTTRAQDGQVAANRRIFFDFTFSPPKSVSIACLIGGDPRIRDAHIRAGEAALKQFESFAAARVRRSDAHGSRLTGNFVAALFTHETSRALDPHLHTHAILFNATWDPVEARWKALENHELLQARSFARSAYYHELARALRGFGYALRDRPRGDFELVGVPEELCTRFSKRHAQIDEALARLLDQKPELARSVDPRVLRRYLAVCERARKQPELSRDELKRIWEAQTSKSERDGLQRLPHQGPGSVPTVSLAEAVSWAEDHLFDRSAVVPEHRIWQAALGRARGGNFAVEELTRFTAARGYIRGPFGAVTRQEELARELEIIRIARNGAHAWHPLVGPRLPADPHLDTDQRRALEGLLSSTHAVTVFRGGAGTGKSFVLRQLVDQVQAAGRSVVVLAPQRQQVVEMEKAGFPSPATVSMFLTRRELPEGAVLIVDEAGQIGGRQMLDLLRLAVGRRARVVLSGDTRQHGPVDASDALLAIERHGGIHPIELRRIRRQDPALGSTSREKRAIAGYRLAVKAAANGDMARSYACLEKMGAIVACEPGSQGDRLAIEYVELASRMASTVVVSQTWEEVHRLNEQIRESLRARGLLGKEEIQVEALERVDLTSAQKSDEGSYPPDAVVVFNRKVRDQPPGSKGKLATVLPDGVLVDTGSSLVRVPNRFLDRLTVCRPREIRVSPGDRLHLKANRQLGPARVTNGELVTVQSVTAGGRIQLNDGRVLGPEFREFLPGYAVTSYGSQGKTVDYVLFSDSGSWAATNAQQWYVSISRGRKGVRIFTPDPSQLRANITHSGHRSLAVDLARSAPTSESLRWQALSRHLQRFGQVALHRLRGLRFLHPKPRNHKAHDHQQSDRRLGV